MLSSVAEYTSSFSSVPPQLFKLFALYTFYSSIHAISASAYSNFCANLSWRGIIWNPLFTVTPQCKGLRWLMSSTHDGMVSWWLTAATWTVTNINWITGSKKNPMA